MASSIARKPISQADQRPVPAYILPQERKSPAGKFLSWKPIGTVKAGWPVAVGIMICELSPRISLRI